MKKQTERNEDKTSNSPDPLGAMRNEFNENGGIPVEDIFISYPAVKKAKKEGSKPKGPSKPLGNDDLGLDYLDDGFSYEDDTTVDDDIRDNPLMGKKINQADMHKILGKWECEFATGQLFWKYGLRDIIPGQDGKIPSVNSYRIVLWLHDNEKRIMGDGYLTQDEMNSMWDNLSDYLDVDFEDLFLYAFDLSERYRIQ